MQRYGECKLPLVPELEQDLSNTKGLRFGTKPETLLEFNKHLKVRKLSEFKIEFKTSHPNGIIFYIANKRNSEFISLYMKGGHVSTFRIQAMLALIM